MFPILARSKWMRVPHPISTMYSAAIMWSACIGSTISVVDCPQITSLVLPSDSLHLASADKAPPKWPGGHNFTTEVNGGDRPPCPSKCNSRLSLRCCHFSGSGMLWINLKNMEWTIAPAVVKAETPHGLYFWHIFKIFRRAECGYRISHLNGGTEVIILFWQILPIVEFIYIG